MTTRGPIEITEVERPVRTTQPTNLQRAIWHLMRQHTREMRAAREEAGRQQARDHEQLRSLVIDLARAHHQLKVFLDRHNETLEGAGLAGQSSLLATIRDRYAQVLTRAGAELIYLDGLPYAHEDSDQLTVTAWIPTPDIDRVQVRETVNPGVLLDGELVCPAEVEVATPAPPEVATAPEVTDEPCDRD